jgi:hypothetical protein
VPTVKWSMRTWRKKFVEWVVCPQSREWLKKQKSAKKALRYCYNSGWLYFLMRRMAQYGSLTWEQVNNASNEASSARCKSMDDTEEGLRLKIKRDLARNAWLDIPKSEGRRYRAYIEASAAYDKVYYAKVKKANFAECRVYRKLLATVIR